MLSPLHDIITGHSEVFWRNLRLTDSLAEGGKDLALNNLKVLHDKRLGFLETHLQTNGGGDFMLNGKCSYADIFLYTCVRAVQKCTGFGEFREFYGSDPFSSRRRISSVCEAVESIKAVSETVGTKFDECPI